MATRPHKRAKCPCCSYENRASLVPAHILSAHTEHIRIRPVTTGHCVLAYVTRDKVDYGFCVCLTCKCGTMGDGYEGNHGRWVTLHSRKKECVDAHPAAFTQLKDRIAALSSDAASPISVLTTTSPCHTTVKTIDDFWDTCRKNKRLRPYVEDIEKFMETEDPSDDYAFDAKDACETAIINACVFRLEFTKKKDEYDKMDCARRYEVDELQRRIKQLEMRTNILEESLRVQKNTVASHTERITELETEISLYKEKYPDPINIPN